jgi:hypothetical protein
MSTLFPLKLYCGIKEECQSLTQTDTCTYKDLNPIRLCMNGCCTPWFWMFYANSRTAHRVPGILSLPIRPSCAA